MGQQNVSRMVVVGETQPKGRTRAFTYVSVSYLHPHVAAVKSRQPRLLDLFCGAGGAAMGYHRAGFEVVGVDINPQPHYPFEFFRGDALEVLGHVVDHDGGGWDAVHASPPCQAWCTMPQHRMDHPELIGPIRDLLSVATLPYVIENVPTAPLQNPMILCGASFGLPIIRHRAFEMSWKISSSPCCPVQRSFARTTFHGPQFAPYARKSWEARWRVEVLPVVWPWMNIAESGQAIPPAYTEFIGHQLLQALGQ
jgi:DNA (cytosine-5)-methyltransferase 1